MNTKITSDHLSRSAVVYVRQSTLSQVTGNLESQRRQYDLAGAAEKAGFIMVTVIDDDLGLSGSGRATAQGSRGWWQWSARVWSARSIASRLRFPMMSPSDSEPMSPTVPI